MKQQSTFCHRVYLTLLVISLVQHGILSDGNKWNITIGLLRNGLKNTFAAEQALQLINNQSKSTVEFKFKKINPSRLLESIVAVGDIAIIIGNNVPAKTAIIVTKLFRVPLIESELRHCHTALSSHGKSSCQDEFQMVPSVAFSCKITLALLRKFSWSNVSLAFQSERAHDVNTFVTYSEGHLFKILVPIESHFNGSITQNSIERIKALASTQIDAIILILDSSNIQSFFDTVKKYAMDLCSIQMNIVIFDHYLNDQINACDAHTIIGTQIQRNYTQIAEKDFLKNVTIRDVLEYDAIFTASNAINQLIKTKKWHMYNESNLWQHIDKRVSNTENISVELKKNILMGASGKIEFDGDGSRRNISLDIVNLRQNKLHSIGKISVDGDVIINQNLIQNRKLQDNDTKINSHLTVVTVVDEPFTFVTTGANGSTIFSGFCVDILDALAEILNFTYTMYLVEDGEYGRYHNGKWTGMIGDVLYRKADMAIASITITSAREEVVKFTQPYMELQNSYVKRRSDLVKFDVFQFMSPFTHVVWVITLAACIIASITIYYVESFSPNGWRLYKTSSEMDENVFSIGNSFWFSVANWLLQGGDNTPRSCPGRVLVGASWFVILIITSTYTANMAAYYTHSKSVTEQEDIESLLKSTVSFSLKQHTALDQFLINSDYRVYRLLSQKIHEQKNYVANATEGVNLVRAKPNLIFLGEGPYSEWLINKGPCHLKIVNGILPSRSYGIPLHKGSPYVEKISIGVSRLEESNFIANRKLHYWHTLSQCNEETVSRGITEEGRVEPLQMMGVYFVLVVGIMISIICLFIEKWWGKRAFVKKRKAEMREKKSQTDSSPRKIDRAHAKQNNVNQNPFAITEFENDWQ